MNYGILFFLFCFQNKVNFRTEPNFILSRQCLER